MSYSATPPGANQTKSFFEASFFRYDCYKSLTIFSPSPCLLSSSSLFLSSLSSIHDLSFVILKSDSSLPWLLLLRSFRRSDTLLPALLPPASPLRSIFSNLGDSEKYGK